MGMIINSMRAVFVLACVVMGFVWGMVLGASEGGEIAWPWALGGAACGVVIALVVLFSLRFVTQEVFDKLSPALAAISVAIIIGLGASQYLFFLVPVPDDTNRLYITTSLVLIFGYMGISLGITRASNWESLVQAVGKRSSASANPKLVDTSVIIDGRIVDVCLTGFIEGTFVVPQFVLHELQRIADSPDTLRRARGRRGLDILKAMQEPTSKIHLEIIDDDPLDIREVDAKLVRVARKYGAKILTNDLNLNKVAQIEGVEVLNINDLANALKPAVLPDENMRVRIVKEGKEALQGVAYLDDGTMIVVDGGRSHMGKEVDVLVTSVLQTSAGRMIFSKMRNATA
jgi:uncharacterized protein YacL